MTAPGGGANLNATLTLNAQQFIQMANHATDALRNLSTQMQRGIQAQGQQTAAQRQSENQLRRQLAIYQQLANITNTYVTAVNKAGSASTQSAHGLTVMTNALTHMQTALQSVTRTSQRQFEGQSRTLTLYQQLANVTNTYAQASQRLSQQQRNEAAAANQAAQANNNLNRGLATQRYALYEVAAAYGAVGLALGKFVLAPVKVAASFEDAFANVARVIGPQGTTQTELDALFNQLQGLAEEIPQTFEDLAGVESLGAQLGIANADLTEFTKTVATFGAVTNVSVNEAALAFGRISNLLHVPSSDFDKLASSIAYVGATSAATETEILAITQSIAGAAGAAGVAAPEVVGLAGALASLKVPPEMARGVVTRLFAEFSKSAATNSDDFLKFAKYLGMTGDAARQLLSDNPGAFFQSLVKGIHDATNSGANLNVVLDEIGVKNVRDINVLQRLTGSYDLWARSVVDANTEYQKGTFLQDAAAIRFDTTVQKLELARNAIKNFAADTGSLANKTFGAVLLPVLDKVLDVLNQIPTPLKSGILALAAIVAAFAAYRAALALAIAGTLAFRQVLQSTLGAGAGAAVSLGTLIAAIRGTGAAAGGAAVQVGVLGRALSFLGGWVGITLTALATIGVAVYSGFQESSHAAEEAAAHAKQMNEAFIAAAGGAEALASAIKQDSDALGSTNGEFVKAKGITAEYTRTIKDLHNGQAQVIDQWVDAEGKAIVGQEAVTRVVNYADSVLEGGRAFDTFAAQQADARKEVGLTTDQLEQQTLAIGKNAVALQAKALQAQFFEGSTDAEGNKVIPLLTPQSQAALEAKLNSYGTTLNTVIAQALTGDNSQVKQAVASLISDVDTQIAQVDTEIAAAQKKVDMDAGERDAQQTARDKAKLVALQERRAALEGEKVGWQNVADATDNAYKATLAYAGSNEFLAGVLKSLGFDDAAEKLDPVEKELKDVKVAADDAIPSLQELGSAFDELVSSMFDIVNNTGAVYEALENLGKGLADNGLDFTPLTENGRENLKNLEAVVEAYSAVLSKAVEDGNLTTEQAAVQMQDYITSLVNSLATEGVDTSQLDFLVRYAAQIVNQPWLMPVGADISGAVAGLDAVNDYAAATYAAIAQMGMDAAATASGANLIEGARMQGYVPSNFVPQLPSFQGPTSFPGAGAQSGINPDDILGQAKAWQGAQNAADAAAQAEKDAGAAGKEAGKATEDAANDAAEAVKKQAEYVKDLAAWYEKLGSAALQTVSNESDVFASLQDFGHQLAEGGTNFDTFSESGRKNFEQLGTVLDAFGATLAEKVEAGTLDAGTAMQQFRQFAGGLRSDLIAAGVPAEQIATYFDALGATANGWRNVSAEVGQYAGQVVAAADYSREFGDAAEEANKRAAEAVKLHLDYLKDLGDAYANMGSSIFTFANATGAVFESLQNLGAAIVENGAHFNVVTAGGRANFQALTDVIDNFGALLQQRVTNGLITAGQAMQQMRQFAGGVYQELRRLGVPASEIHDYFTALGIDITGFEHASASVRQFAGVLTNAAAAARAAAQGVDALSISIQIAEDWASRLGEAFSTAFTRLYGVQEARDAVTSAILDMRDAAQAAKDKITELRDANKQLQADLMQASADKLKASTLKAIALKYGDATRAAQYGADEADAKQREQEAKDKLKANEKEAKAIKKNSGVLKGNSREAIENRNSVRGLQQQMYEQIAAYAATGATTQQVEKYTKDLKAQFIATGVELGYSKTDLEQYSDAFDTYATLVKNTPRVVTTTVNADTSPASAALNALPDGGTYTIVAKAETQHAKDQLKAIPDEQDYKVTVTQTGASGVTNTLTHIPRTGTYSVTARTASGTVQRMMNSIPKKGDYKVSVRVPSGGSGSPADARNRIARGLAGFTPTIHAKVTTDDPAGVKRAIQTALSSITATISKLDVFGVITTPKLTATWVYGTSFDPGRIGGTPYTGGLITNSGVQVGGFAGGGLVPGTPPRNPRGDNLLVRGPGGLFGLRSGEWVIRQQASDYYGNRNMAAINNMQVDKRIIGMATGGAVGTYSNTGQGGMMVSLSPEDRAMLARLGQIANRPIDLYADEKLLATSTATGNGRVARRGGN